MNPMSKFGFSLFSASSVALIVLKAMNATHTAINTAFYNDLVAFATLFAVFLAIFITLIFAVCIKSFIILVILFIGSLVVSFVVLAPIYLESV